MDYDQRGNILGALPPNAVRIDSLSGNVHTLLTGKYVDPDGIVYEPDGTVNESATALYARQIATLRVAPASSMYQFSTVDELRQQSINEQSQAAATSAYIDALFSNVYTTAQEIPQDVANAVGGAWTITQWLIVGLVAIAAIQALDKVPSQGHVKRYVRRKVREHRRQIARHVAGA